MKTGLEDLMKKLDPKNVKHKKPGMRKIAVTRLERTLPTWKTVILFHHQKLDVIF